MGAWVDVFGVGGRVLAVVYDLVDKILGEDNGLNFPPEGLLEYVLLGEVNGLVCIVGCIEFRLCGQEYIIRDAGCEWAYLLKEYSSLGVLGRRGCTFYRVFY